METPLQTENLVSADEAQRLLDTAQYGPYFVAESAKPNTLAIVDSADINAGAVAWRGDENEPTARATADLFAASWSLAETAVALHTEVAVLKAENECLRGLLDAAPKLMPPADGGPDLLDRVDTVVAMTAEIVRLGAIIEGRTVAPTDHELEVHGARGGRWRTRYQVGDPALCRDGMEATEAREVRDRMRPLHVYTWWATEADGTPCAWPEVSQ